MKKMFLCSLFLFLFIRVGYGGDSKTTALDAIVGPVTTDLLYIVDDPSGSAASKKITLGNLFNVSSHFDTSGNVIDFGLTTNADAGDSDIQSIGKLEFFDVGLYIDGSVDGVLGISSDGTLSLTSSDWSVSTTGVMTNMGNITSDGTIEGATFTASSAIQGATSLWYRAVHMNALNVATGASGATWTAPSANTLGGYQLNAVGEILYTGDSVTSMWDGASDLIVNVTWEVNEAASADGTVDLQLICYYKGDHDTATKSQTLEEAHTITGNKAQYTRHVTSFTIDYDAVDNIVEIADKISFVLNLETDTSECDNIIINTIMFKYKTKKMNPEV